MAVLLTDDLLSNPYINRADGKKHVIMISRDDTSSLSDKVNTRKLVATVRKALNDSGKVYCSVGAAISGSNIDPAVKAARELRNSNEVREGSKIGENQIENPDHSLFVVISEERTTRGNKTQYVYQVEMYLNQLSTGVARWEGIEDISKTGPGKGRKW